MTDRKSFVYFKLCRSNISHGHSLPSATELRCRISSWLCSVRYRASVSARGASRINLAVATRPSIVAISFLFDHIIWSIVRRGQLAVSISNGPKTRTDYYRLLQAIRPAKGQADNRWRGKERVRAPKRDCRSHQGAAATAATA